MVFGEGRGGGGGGSVNSYWRELSSKQRLDSIG